MAICRLTALETLSNVAISKFQTELGVFYDLGYDTVSILRPGVVEQHSNQLTYNPLGISWTLIKTSYELLQ